MTSPALQSVEILDAIARAIAEHSRADEFPKYADDPSIYRGAVEGAIANLCKARGVRQRLIVYKIQAIAWQTAERAGTLADVKAVLAIANDEINAIRENNAAADKRILIAKTEPVRFGGERTVTRDNIAPRPPKPTLPPEAPKPALTGGLFGTKATSKQVVPSGETDNADDDLLNAEVAADIDPWNMDTPQHPLDEFVPPATPPAPVAPAADADKATKAEESAILPRFWTVVGPLFEVVGLKDEARLAFIHKALCVEHLNAYQPAKVNGKEAITNAAIHDVMAALRAIYPDAFTADSSGALAVKSAAPTVSALEAAPAVASGAVEIIAKQEDKPVTPTPTLTEASVIIFAKSDVYLTLPDGNVLALSITLREGANLDEVKRLLDMYKQIVALPGVSAAHPVSRPQPAPAVVPPAPQPAAPAQPPAAPTQTAPANGNGERISKVVSGVKVAFDEKGQKNLQLFGKYGDNWGTGPDHTCRKGEEVAQAIAIAGVDMSSLTPGEIFAVQPFTVTWTKGKETKPGSGRFYHDNPTFTRN